MPLRPGTTLGPYQIDAPLSAGGMGEVYKATDTRLDRTVAMCSRRIWPPANVSVQDARARALTVRCL